MPRQEIPMEMSRDRQADILITCSCSYIQQRLHCNTRYPVWLDLMGGTLPRLGEKKEARCCVTQYDDCCVLSNTVTVRNCGDFFIYRLQPTLKYPFIYCSLHCSTPFPVWLDLMGGTLPRLGEEKKARSCLTLDDDCCYLNDTVTVRNCGDFFIYKLQPTPESLDIYCVSM
ncbi:uncharacterized protein [Littorina saxatilis]|uniref:uncharacterized protein n=1 Tax=Littorina saxatilis TaxID=31220 RepID=UPI0038B61AB6